MEACEGQSEAWSNRPLAVTDDCNALVRNCVGPPSLKRPLLAADAPYRGVCYSLSVIKPMLQCRTLEGWFPLEIQSGSDPDVNYVVHVNPWGRSEKNICECKSYLYRGRCKHQKIAHQQICGWNEVEGPEEATPEQRAARECPRCGGPAMWAMWETDDES